MSLKDYFLRVMGFSKTEGYEILIEKFEEVHLQESALNTVLGRVKASAELVQFRTDDEDLNYLLNVSPNHNQNASSFRAKLIDKMVREGEVLVVQINDQWHIADSFYCVEKALVPNVYRDITLGDYSLSDTFVSSQVYHFKYYNQRLNKFLSQLNNSYSDLFSRLIEIQMRQSQIRVYAKFNNVNDPAKHDEYENKYKKMLESLSKALRKNSVVVSPRSDAYDVEESTDKYLGRSVTELQAAENIYIGKVANALQMSPLLFTGDLADIEQHERNAIKYGIRPLMNIIVNEICMKWFGHDYEHDLVADTTPLTYNNIFEMAKDIEKLVGSGTVTPNEMRLEIGKEAVDDERLDDYYLTKNIAKLGQEE